jgi:hypothetical protein
MAAEAPPNGYALFTSDAIEAMGLDPEGLGLRSGEESIEHLGHVATFTLDLEARWQTESSLRRVEIPAPDVVLDVGAMLAAEPSVVWAHLTSPPFRARWEGPLIVEDPSGGGRRGVGTTAQCVTGRLSTLEEIVDWQPYDHVAWNLAVPGLGPVAAIADLDPVSGGTNVRLRLAYQGVRPGDAVAIERFRVEKEAAFRRLAAMIDGALPVELTEVAESP